MPDADTISRENDAGRPRRLPQSPQSTTKAREPWAIQRAEDPYAVACAWVEADPRVRVARSATSASNYKSISRLPRPWGERLDALGVTMGEVTWLAGATGHAHGAQREARYLALVQMLEAPDPDETRAQNFARIKARLPRVRAQKRARTHRTTT